MLNRRDCFHNALRIPVTRCVSGSAFYARVLNLKLCVELFEKVQESSIHLDFLDPAQVLGVRMATSKISARRAVCILQLPVKFPVRFYPFFGY